MVVASCIEGRGLVAVEPISKDEIVAIKGGHIVDINHAVNGRDWQRPELQRRHGSYFSSCLLRRLSR